MIFYFSGTGNSLYVAKNIAEYNHEKLIAISKAIRDDNTYQLADNEVIGFVFPIYAWGPPKIVLEFIEKLKIGNYRKNYVFCVVTCGGAAGNAMKVMSACLSKKGIPINGGFSVIMPNNYILMGDVDSKEKEKEKLSLAEETLQYINYAIEQRTHEFRVKKGRFACLLTGLINPMFNRHAIDPKKFYVNDQCNGCGLCEKVCNCSNIKVKQSPHWGQNCAQCLACIHYCPVKAIQYGKGTEKKGRYTNPNISVDEMS
jgi:ferredoxin